MYFMWTVSCRFEKVPNITLFNLYWNISGPMSEFSRTSRAAFGGAYTCGNLAVLKTKMHIDTEPRGTKGVSKNVEG